MTRTKITFFLLIQRLDTYLLTFFVQFPFLYIFVGRQTFCILELLISKVNNADLKNNYNITKEFTKCLYFYLRLPPTSIISFQSNFVIGELKHFYRHKVYTENLNVFKCILWILAHLGGPNSDSNIQINSDPYCEGMGKP